MRLRRFGCEGFRRFADAQTVEAGFKLTAVVGPNESGKTSLLHALAELAHETPIAASDLTRFRRPPPDAAVVWATFDVDAADRVALAATPEAMRVTSLTISKSADGSVWRTLTPEVERDRGPRLRVLKPLIRAAEHRIVAGVPAPEPAQDSEPDVEAPRSLSVRLRELVTELEADVNELSPAVVIEIHDLSTALESLATDKAPAYIRQLATQLQDLRKHEAMRDPREVAMETLESRTPQFVAFLAEDRTLRSEYSLDELRNEGVPQALKNVMALAEVNLDQLLAAIDQRDPGSVSTLASRGTATLQAKLRAWSQADITCEIAGETEGRVIRVHIGTEAGGLWRFEDHSAGLQWFVALIAFLHARAARSPAVVLVDEAEQHLHYDAQADLIKTMESQDLVGSVVYTTHSAGCLPEDLSAVRIVQATDSASSRVRNWFWETHQAGLSSVIMEMGATRFAFVHSRASVICEGPSDFILLPSLLRQAGSYEALGFQIAPGLAEVSDNELRRLRSEAGWVGYVTDNDPGGQTLRARLKSVGVKRDQIFKLPGRVKTIEDLVDATVFTAAVTEVIKKNGSPEVLNAAVLPKSGRWLAVKAWCNARSLPTPNKRQVAHRVLELGGPKIARVEVIPGLAALLESIRRGASSGSD